MSKFSPYPKFKILKRVNHIIRLSERKPSSKWCSWGKACTRCEGSFNSYIKQYEKFYKKENAFLLKWNNCQLECGFALYKVAYNYDNSWSIKAYQILERLNDFPVKEDIELSVSSLFKQKAVIEYCDLELFVERNLLKSSSLRPIKTNTWSKAKIRAYVEFKKLLNNKTRTYFERQTLWGLCLDYLLDSNLLNKPFKMEKSNFNGINKIHIETDYYKVRNRFRKEYNGNG